MAATLPQEPDAELERLACELNACRAELQSALDKLRTVTSNPFTVLGEARVTENGVTLTILGDEPAEPRLGLPAGTFPKTIEAALGMLHPEDHQPFQQMLGRSLASGEPFNLCYRLPDGHGGWRCIEGMGVSVEVRDGKHVGWLFTNRDVTPQKEAQTALRNSMDALRLARSELKSEQDRLWKIAANAFSLLGEARLTQTGMELEYFGDVPPETKVGLPAGSVPTTTAQVVARMHQDDVGPFQQALEHSVMTGEPFRTIYRLSDGRSGWRWLQVRAFSVEARDGKHVRWLHDTIDITERKETEEALRRSVEELRRLKARLQSENLFLREEVDRETEHRDIIGRSAAAARVMEQVELVSATSSTVLISGETGTGKELVARAIHQHSERRKRLFVAVNCAALPASLVESELFGHEKGAFTGATARRAGRFEQADGGTLFLDEVGELPPEVQAKMLRVLQSGEFERVGGSRQLRTNVRIIAASNRDLEQAVRDGRFRSDLYHRLAIFLIHLPPLRERREDIPLLAAYLATRKARQLKRNIERIPSDILHRLTAYAWPGNVRELENVLERAIILSPGNSILPQAVQLGSAPTRNERPPPASAPPAPVAGESDTMQAAERAHIVRICQSTAWRIKGPDGAAKKLGLNPGTLFARMKRLGIHRPATA